MSYISILFWLMQGLESNCTELENEVVELRAQVAKSCSNELLVSVQRKPREMWGQFMIELAMQLSAQGLKPRQCSEVLKIFMSILYPNLEDGKDYHLPHEARFKEWRRWIYPVLHHWCIILLMSALTMTVIHDASSKFIGYKRRHIFAASVDAVYRDGVKITVPLMLSHLTKADAATEAAVLIENMKTPFGGGVQLHTLSIIASVSDGAAKATSKEFEGLRNKEIDRALQVAEEYGDDVDSCLEADRSLFQSYLNLPEEIKEDIRKFGVYRCLSHRINLMGEHER